MGQRECAFAEWRAHGDLRACPLLLGGGALSSWRGAELLLCPQSPSVRHLSHQIVEIQCGCFKVITAGSVQWRGTEILT